MPIDAINLIGSGGHALVVLDSLAALGVPDENIRIFDNNPDRAGQEIAGRPVELLDDETMPPSLFHICVGNNQARERLARLLQTSGHVAHTIVDPRAMVSPSAIVGQGSFVAPGSIIAAQAKIGRYCIVNHGAIIDHQCRVDDFAHVAPGATLAGGVTIGQGTLVGAGANILPGVSVAPGSTLGAGAVLIDNASEPAVYVGVPARKT